MREMKIPQNRDKEKPVYVPKDKNKDRHTFPTKDLQNEKRGLTKQHRPDDRNTIYVKINT